MKIKFSLTLSAFMILINGAFSQNVPIITAQNVAKNFYFERAVNHNPTLRYANINLTNILTKTRGSNNIYYVFNVDSGRGWIVTAAQQNVVPILAFSTEGNFDTVKANQPPAFKYWMKNYESQINYAIDNNIQADSAISNKWTYLNSNSAINTPKQIQSVGPLLQTTWAQNCYYNAMCPVDNTTSCTGGGIPSPCGHVWVGCVAEAMGQVMKYWNYPETGTGSHIDATSYGNLYANFGTTIYAWPNMPNNVTSANTDVAILLYHCGIAADMNYGPCASGSNTLNAKNALLWYFRYDLNAFYSNKDDDGYSDASWANLITNNLNNSFPVIMGGQDISAGDGHEWVCDGYSSANYFHMNWGWGWSGGGNYCYISAIIPTSTPPQPNYTSSQDAIFNLAPSCGTTLNTANTTGPYGDRCVIYLEPGFTTQPGSTFHAKIVP